VLAIVADEFAQASGLVMMTESFRSEARGMHGRAGRVSHSFLGWHPAYPQSRAAIQ